MKYNAWKTGGDYLLPKPADPIHLQSPGPAPTASDGSTASYYELPADAKELQALISRRNMNAQIGEIFRACYRYGLVEHSPRKRDVKKIIFYAQAELDRLEALDAATPPA
jgi:hypothetical protein